MNCKNCKASCVHKGEDYSGKCLVGYEPMTNADKIRQMTDDQLAMLLDQTQLSGYRFGAGLDYTKRNGAYDWLMWLKEEVKENAN